MRIIRCSLAWLYVMLLRLTNSQLPQAESCVAPSAIELPIEVDGQHDTVRLRPDEPLTHTAHHFCAERHAMRFASALAKSQCTDVVLRYLERRRSELWCDTEDGGVDGRSRSTQMHAQHRAPEVPQLPHVAPRLKPQERTALLAAVAHNRTSPAQAEHMLATALGLDAVSAVVLEALVSLSVLDLPLDDEPLLRAVGEALDEFGGGQATNAVHWAEAVRRLRHDADAELVERLVMAMLSAGKLRHRSRCALRSAIHRYKSLRFPDGDACLLSLLPKAHECPKTQHVHSQPPFSPNPLPSPWPQRESRCRQDALRTARHLRPFHLIVQWFRFKSEDEASDKVAEALEQKQRDVDDALRLNAALQRHGVLARPLHILLEDAADAAVLRQRVPEIFDAPGSSKLIVIGERLTFSRAFRYANDQLAGEYCVLANADIYFDWTLHYARYFLRNEQAAGSDAKVMLALLKWEEIRRDHFINGTATRLVPGKALEPELLPRSDSQDAWIFRAPLPADDTSSGTQWLDRCNFAMGTLGCDNRLANVLRSHGGMTVLNPALFVRAVHRDSHAATQYAGQSDAVQRYRGRSNANYRSEDCCQFVYLTHDVFARTTEAMTLREGAVRVVPNVTLQIDGTMRVAHWLQRDANGGKEVGQSSSAAAAGFCHELSGENRPLGVFQCLQLEQALQNLAPTSSGDGTTGDHEAVGNGLQITSPSIPKSGQLAAFPSRERVYIDLHVDSSMYVNVSLYIDFATVPLWNGVVPRYKEGATYQEPLYLDRPTPTGYHVLYVVPHSSIGISARKLQERPPLSRGVEAFGEMRARGAWPEAVFFVVADPSVDIQIQEHAGRVIKGTLRLHAGDNVGKVQFAAGSFERACITVQGVSVWCRLIRPDLLSQVAEPGGVTIPFALALDPSVGSDAFLEAIVVHKSRRVVGHSRITTVKVHGAASASHLGAAAAIGSRDVEYEGKSSTATLSRQRNCAAALQQYKVAAQWLCALEQHEWGYFAQNGEDGIIAAIFAALGQPVHTAAGRRAHRPGSGFYVEFGTEDGSECNTRLLRERHNWRGLLMDGGHENASIGLRKEWISAEAINLLFEKHGVPNDIDLLSIDLDYNDYWVWRAIDETRFSARVVIVEYNGHVPPDEARTVRYVADGMWDGETDYSGAGVGALAHLARAKGYSLIYCESHGVNCFFVRNDILGFDASAVLQPRLVHRTPNYFGRGWRYTHDTEREWVWVDR